MESTSMVSNKPFDVPENWINVTTWRFEYNMVSFYIQLFIELPTVSMIYASNEQKVLIKIVQASIFQSFCNQVASEQSHAFLSVIYDGAFLQYATSLG